MDLIKARLLLENLLERVEVLEDGTKQLSGKLTDNELKALQFALSSLATITEPKVSTSQPPLTDTPIPPVPEFPPPEPKSKKPGEMPVVIEAGIDSEIQNIELDLSVFNFPTPPKNTRLCLDFGTAMSKVVLVQDNQDNDFEEIKVLQLGIPGEQEDISEVMLVSSVFIDDDGLLWFGQRAIDEAKLQPEGSNRLQLDNIKRYLSESGLKSKVSEIFNPTEIEITYSDLILAYLMFLTWCVNHSLDALNGHYPRNLSRRFAMPCLSDPAAAEAEYLLRKYLGEAQVLADSFFTTLTEGIPLESFMAALKDLRSIDHTYSFVTEKISEPLGVAGSLLGPESETDMLAMVIDVGAGTTDFSLYRIKVDLEEEINSASEIEGTTDFLSEAGNYLDNLLKSIIIKKTEISFDDSSMRNINWELEKNIRNLKETLFNEGEVFIYLRESDSEVTVTLSEFLALSQVQAFGDSLRDKVIKIMESVSSEFSDWILRDSRRRLTLVLTGGGASLPMVKSLAEGSISVHGMNVPLKAAKSFPTWLDEEHPELEVDYPRIAVALGGARKNIIQSRGPIHTGPADGGSKPTMGPDFTSGR